MCVHHENRHLLPALTDAGVDLDTLLQDAPELVGAAAGGGR
ncbi:hypothetical protein [Blastococcus tunisiensis]|nr:hypothetical protein [Blastococcus sp. DSM 46838]